MKQLILFLCVITCTLILKAQNIVGNGGDVVASEFNSIARTSAYFLGMKSLSWSDQLLVAEIQKKIETTLVESVSDDLVLDGRIVDAINYPSISKIKISRKRWEQIRLRNPSERAMIVLHEYIWIAGTNDGNYAVSSRLTKVIEHDLDKNSVSTEKYQVALAEFYAELVLFHGDILGMQATGTTDFQVLCYGAGTLRAHATKVVQLTVENGFWFSITQRTAVDDGVALIQKFSNKQVDDCRTSTPVDFASTLANSLKVSSAIHYLMMTTQFPESSL